MHPRLTSEQLFQLIRNRIDLKPYANQFTNDLLNQTNTQHQSPLHFAIQEKNYAAIKVLVESGYKLLNYNYQSITGAALYTFFHVKDASMLSALIIIENLGTLYFFFPNQVSVTPLYALASLCSENDKFYLPVFLSILNTVVLPNKERNINDIFNLNGCILFLCLHRNSIKDFSKIILSLIECGAKMACHYQDYNTHENALHMLAQDVDRHRASFQLLLHHATPNYFISENKQKKTPLHLLVNHLSNQDNALLEEYVDCFFAQAIKNHSSTKQIFTLIVDSVLNQLHDDKKYDSFYIIKNRVRFLLFTNSFSEQTRKELKSLYIAIQTFSLNEIESRHYPAYFTFIQLPDQFQNLQLLGTLLSVAIQANQIETFIFLYNKFILSKQLNQDDQKKLNLQTILAQLIQLKWPSQHHSFLDQFILQLFQDIADVNELYPSGNNVLHILFSTIRTGKEPLSCYYPILKFILEKNPGLLDQKNNQGNLPIHILCSYVKEITDTTFFYPVFVRTTLSQLKTVNNNLQTPLDVAVEWEKYFIVEAFMQMVFNSKLRNPQSTLSLEKIINAHLFDAIEENDFELLITLIGRNGQISRSSLSELFKSIDENPFPDLFQSLIANQYKNALLKTDRLNNTFLFTILLAKTIACDQVEKFKNLCFQLFTWYDSDSFNKKNLRLGPILLQLIRKKWLSSDDEELNEHIHQLFLYDSHFDVHNTVRNNVFHLLCSDYNDPLRVDILKREFAHATIDKLDEKNFYFRTPIEQAVYEKNYAVIRALVETGDRLQKENPQAQFQQMQYITKVLQKSLDAPEPDFEMVKALVTIDRLHVPNLRQNQNEPFFTTMQYIAYYANSNAKLMPIFWYLLHHLVAPNKEKNTNDHFRLHLCILYFLHFKNYLWKPWELEKLIPKLFGCGVDPEREQEHPSFSDIHENPLHVISKQISPYPSIYLFLLDCESFPLFNQFNHQAQSPLHLLLRNAQLNRDCLEKYMDSYLASKVRFTENDSISNEVKQKELNLYDENILSVSAELLKNKSYFFYSVLHNRLLYLQSIKSFLKISKSDLQALWIAVLECTARGFPVILNDKKYSALFPSENVFWNIDFLYALLSNAIASNQTETFIYLCNTFLFSTQSSQKNTELTWILTQLIRFGWLSISDPDLQECIEKLCQLNSSFEVLDYGQNNLLHMLFESVSKEKNNIQSHHRMLTCILKKAPNLMNQQNNQEQVPVHILCMCSDSPIYIHFFKEVLAHVTIEQLNTEDTNYKIPFHYAVTSQCHFIIRHCVDLVCSQPDLDDPDIATLFDAIIKGLKEAMQLNKFETVKLLARIQNLGIEFNEFNELTSQNITPIVFAIKLENKAIFQYFLDEIIYKNKEKTIGNKSFQLTKALHFLCRSKFFDMDVDQSKANVLRLLECGADLNETPTQLYSPNNENPLHVVLKKGKRFHPIACILIHHSPDFFFEQKNRFGYTPLHVLIQQNEECLNTLMALLPRVLSLSQINNPVSFEIIGKRCDVDSLNYLLGMNKTLFYHTLAAHKQFLISLEKKEEFFITLDILLWSNIKSSLPFELWGIIFAYCKQLRDPRFRCINTDDNQFQISEPEFKLIFNPARLRHSHISYPLLEGKIKKFLKQVKPASFLSLAAKTLTQQFTSIINNPELQSFPMTKIEIIRQAIQEFLNNRSTKTGSGTLILLLKLDLVKIDQTEEKQADMIKKQEQTMISSQSQQSSATSTTNQSSSVSSDKTETDLLMNSFFMVENTNHSSNTKTLNQRYSPNIKM